MFQASRWEAARFPGPAAATSILMTRPRVLLTGFEPFGSFKVNPSWAALKLAQADGLLQKNARFLLAEIPVDYARAFSVFDKAARMFKPQVAVSFGVHGGLEGRELATIYIERIARNRDQAAKPDNAGQVRGRQAIIANAPKSLRTRYVLRGLRSRLSSAGFEAKFSGNAGGYLCNHLFFRAAWAYQDRFPCLFVHVPPVAGGRGVIRIESLAKAVGLIAQHAANQAQ